jgi:2-keto-4-pentenoate hydratase
MIPEAVDRAAKILKVARLKHELIEDLPETCRPTTIADAYAIQDRLVELLGEPVAGWLVGCTNVEIQRQLGLSEPYAARVLASSLFKSPATLWLPATLPPILEVEFAFTLSQDLPHRATPYSHDEVANAIRSVHPAIEAVLGHLRDWPSKDIYSVVADNGTDGALILGEGVTEWQSLDLAGVATTLSVNGRLVREGAGSRVLAGPLSVMTWLANHNQRSPGLRAGQIVNTGSCTPMCSVQAGDVAVADFGPLGAVTLEIARAESRVL